MSSFRSRFHRIPVTLALITAVMSASLFLAPTNALAYNCFTAPGITGHCYAKNNWYMNVLGAYTHVSLFPMHVDTSPGRMTMEIWINDTGSSLCPNFLCSIEAGYTWAAGPRDCTGQGTGCMRYFHAENVYPYGYVETVDFPEVPKADLDRGDIGIEVWINTDHQWSAIVIYAASGNYSTGVLVPMYMNQIQMGAEISGTDGAHGQQTWFGSNIWLDPFYNAIYQVTPFPFGPSGYNDQTVTDQSVIYGDFYVPPSYHDDGGIWRVIPPP